MPEPCDCHIVYRASEISGYVPTIERCSLHAAAGEMLKALKRLVDDDWALHGSNPYSFTPEERDAWLSGWHTNSIRHAQQAIHAAATRAAPSATTPAPTIERTS